MRESAAQQRLFEAEAEVEKRNWKRRNSDIAYREINQEFESHRFQLLKQVDGQIRLRETKISLSGELELRSRLFQEDPARDCREPEEFEENLLQRN